MMVQSARVAACLAAGLMALGCATDTRPPESRPPRPIEPDSSDIPRPRPVKPGQIPMSDATAPGTLKEVFPHVRADMQNGLVEFDAAISPALVADPDAPLFFLEVVACIPDTREHETLVVTEARPSHIHAALLLIGLEPGKPGAWKFENEQLIPVPPAGKRIDVRFEYTGTDGQSVEAAPTDWIVSARDGSPFAADSPASQGWVFAGSRFLSRNGAEVYDADGAGNVIGLTTFGNELVAWGRVISPDADVQEPEWIARTGVVPPPGTPVRVRIRPAR